MRKVALLGSSGSIGQNTLHIVEKYPEQFSIFALAVHTNIQSLAKDILKFSPEYVVVFDPEQAATCSRSFPKQKIVIGLEGLVEIVSHPEVDFVMQAMSGSLGLSPTIKALEAGKTVGLANKESLIMGGEILSKKNKGKIIPVDSEHSAIFQCIDGKNIEDIHRVILTASGGPFWHRDPSTFKDITLEEALIHPNWSMGKKVTIDSSTLMNKGLEVIEASYLFDLPPEKIEVVIHPQSLVHSFVEWKDGSMMAQIALPDMKLPIQYALTYPEREETPVERVDFSKASKWEFYPYDKNLFPCLDLAYQALKRGNSYPCFINVANEILVERFMAKEICWHEIGDKLRQLISFHQVRDLISLQSVNEVIEEAKLLATKV